MVTLTLALLLAQTPDAKPTGGAATVTPGKVVSDMMNHYYNSSSSKGRIQMIQSAQGIAISVDTEFQFAPPSKIYIKQVRRSTSPAVSLVTSNGKHFSYPTPETPVSSKGADRLIETVVQQGVPLDYRQIYAAVSESLLDRCAPLDLAFARTEDLKYLRDQWATLDFLPGDNPAGDRVLGGQWRAYGSVPPAGTYKMTISKNNELKKFEMSESVAFTDKIAGVVTTTWTCEIQTNATPEEKLFTLVR